MKIQEKSLYVAPTSEILCARSENLMIVASPGVGGDYEEGDPIDSKGNEPGEEEDIWKLHDVNLWD